MPSDDKDEDPMKNVQFPEGKRIGGWIIGKMIDEGGFGRVYLVTHPTDKAKIAALKAESNTIEGGSAIKLENMILKQLNSDGPAPHIPIVHHCARHKQYSFIVMTLLGKNLRKLKTQLGTGFSRGTWSRIGIQCLYALKFVHEKGFIHRDIKPQNFLMGNENDKERCRLVHILDFGLARPFATFKADTKKWVARKPRGSAEFRGTIRYASPNVHLKKEQGRGDDIWSLLYVLIELNGGPGLPWQTESSAENVELMKLGLSNKIVLSNMPSCLEKVMNHLATLNYYQRPDYHLVFKAFWQVMENEKVTPSSKYDWEKEAPEKSTTPAAWEDSSGAYFQSDVLEINEL